LNRKRNLLIWESSAGEEGRLPYVGITDAEIGGERLVKKGLTGNSVIGGEKFGRLTARETTTQRGEKEG